MPRRVRHIGGAGGPSNNVDGCSGNGDDVLDHLVLDLRLRRGGYIPNKAVDWTGSQAPKMPPVVNQMLPEGVKHTVQQLLSRIQDRKHNEVDAAHQGECRSAARHNIDKPSFRRNERDACGSCEFQVLEIQRLVGSWGFVMGWLEFELKCSVSIIWE
ncbi:hypothetical protein K432DRAFT_430859 [Lepidopterella palustris CBS 459.81]|uniref:Uncharacterized protein n=1 Tax=Lepidopterella palustris CBS 459.81 TaxID=1314670 RepID=A0A8E2DW34_9PEZI|nr:hypothetical protein K432DRAFT_430859 [Lepidopterella palustris CBS 459.81]